MKMHLFGNIYHENGSFPLGRMKSFTAEVVDDGWIDVSINGGPRLWFEPRTQFTVGETE